MYVLLIFCWLMHIAKRNASMQTNFALSLLFCIFDTVLHTILLFSTAFVPSARRNHAKLTHC